MVFTGPFKICWSPGIKQGIVVTGIIVYVEAMMYTYMIPVTPITCFMLGYQHILNGPVKTIVPQLMILNHLQSTSLSPSLRTCSLTGGTYKAVAHREPSCLACSNIKYLGVADAASANLRSWLAGQPNWSTYHLFRTSRSQLQPPHA